MSNSISISGTIYTVNGSVKKDNKGVLDLHVEVYDKDIFEDDFLGIGVTDSSGNFEVSFDSSKFSNILDRKPDLYFVVLDYGLELLNTKEKSIDNASEVTAPINLVIDMLNEKTRGLINKTAVEGWIGGFKVSDLSTLDMLGNMQNIKLLKRQQKVVWPEFSWNSEPTASEKKMCYQMFAPDISRLGYTNEGRVYSIICPQQGYATKHFGSLNVEVTVTGNRGWADETDRILSADMSVTGKIWFAPDSLKREYVKMIKSYFSLRKLPFPFNKKNAIEIQTFLPNNPSTPEFPLISGQSHKFDIPKFAQHKEISWSVGNLEVQIGAIKPTNSEKVNKFNQLILDIFNTASGNMLSEGNILYWNVWFTAPEEVKQKEWKKHAELWRKSIQADHGAPNGQGTISRYFDGTPFKPLKNLVDGELPKILAFITEHLDEKTND